MFSQFCAKLMLEKCTIIIVRVAKTDLEYAFKNNQYLLIHLLLI